MTGTNEKLRALFLSLLMVGSVFGATVAVSGTAAAAVSDAGTPNDLVVGSADAGTQHVTNNIIVDTTGDVEIDVSALQENGVDLSSADAGVTINPGSDGDAAASVTGFDTTTGVVTVDVTQLDGTDGTADFDLTLSGLDTSGADASASGLTYEVTDVSASDSANSATFAFAEGSISGSITDAGDASAIEGATVELTDDNAAEVVATTTTDSNGDYSFDSVSGGTYTVTVTADTYVIATSGTSSLQDTTTSQTVDQALSQPTIAVNSQGTTAGDDVTFRVSDNPEDIGGEVVVRHNYNDQEITLTGTTTDATFSQAKATNQDGSLIVAGSEVDNAAYTTDDYYVTADPSTVVLSTENTIDANVYQWYDTEAETGDLYQESINYALVDEGDATQETGSTSTGAFSVDGVFDSAGDWFVGISTTTDAVNIDSTAANNEGGATVTVEDRNIVENFTVDPSSPAYNDEVTISGNLVDSNGDPVTGNSIEIRTQSGGAGSLVGVDTTGSNGGFSITATLNDARTWYVHDAGDTADVETIDVGAANANVTITADGENFQGFSETYTVTAKDEAGNVLPLGTFAGEGAGAYDSSGANYLNITGPFDGTVVSDTDSTADVYISQGTLLNSDTDGDQDETNYIHVVPAQSDGAGTEAVVIEATPTVNAAEVTAQLETDDGTDLIDGYEDTAFSSPTAPDLLGDDSAATATADQDLIVNVQESDISVTGAADGDGAQSINVDVVGSDNQKPADGNALADATVTISAPDIGIEEQSVLLDGANEGQDGSTATFGSLNPEQAGEVSIDVTGHTDDGAEVSESLTLPVLGDSYNSLSPSQATIDDARQDVSLQVTDSDGTPLNNRIVVLTGVTFNASSPQTANNYETDTTLVIHGPDGQVKVGGVGGTVVQDFSSVNNGDYIAENVSFDTTGSIDLEVANSAYDDSRIDEAAAISVTGVESYEISSNRSAALAGANEVHNLTITEDGDIVNGTALDDFTVSYEPAAEVTEVTAPSSVDTDGDGTNDALQVELRAENSTAPLNITIDDGESRTGSTTLDVVEPEITTTLGGDDLTFGLVSEMNVTVEDPRDGSALGKVDVDLSAVNASFQLDDLSDETGPDATTAGNSETVTVNENGTRAVSVAPEQGTAEAAPQTLNVSTSLDTANGAYGQIAINTGNITLEDTPEDLEPSSDYSLVLNAVDANGDQLDLLGVEISGALDGGAQSKLTDEGLVNFDFTTTESGTITYTVDDSITGSEVDLVTDTAQASDDASFQVATTNVYEQVNLSLAANTTDIAQNDTVMFTLTREDFDRQTTGTLTVRNASGDVVNTVSIDQTANVTFDSAGEFAVEASKPTRTQVGKAFVNDTVDVSVEAPVDPGAVMLDNVNLDPSTVDANTTNEHMLTFDAMNVSDDGDTDTFTVTIPDAATLDSANSVSVTDADGENVSLSGGPDVSGNVITFSVAPDSSAEFRDLTVEANVTVSAPDVANTTTADLSVEVSDSDNGDDSVTATLTVEAVTDDTPEDAVYEPGSAAAEYDGDNDGLIDIGELGSAAEAFSSGELDIGQLGSVAEAFSAS
ncbi:carboxypeptidase regulatory-like domain-containing protein [Halosimplex litoreum]|uniref:Carboxypeptidase regulatory-like domain-containing protein n=1 Tax=Halosimplex litoreum TaxID=1198301 RepID=A0A7U3WBL9_9EURY|nr:carboxypeptidase regulatory-like domain-containing protein [Halosimplex litoreum]QPV65014.1 carboxypeptidase regulatory-like domain-containing protein [Halosimplex litoreum]